MVTINLVKQQKQEGTATFIKVLLIIPASSQLKSILDHYRPDINLSRMLAGMEVIGLKKKYFPEKRSMQENGGCHSFPKSLYYSRYVKNYIKNYLLFSV